MHFLYASDPFRTKKPDEFYADEFDALRTAGFELSVFSLEALQADSFAAFPPLPAGTIILYRGWMLSPREYETLAAAVERAGSKMLIDLPAYLSTHYLPNWYPLVSDLTPETRIFPPTANLADELRLLDWPAYFIKDYVKSLKTSVGSIISNPSEATAVASEMLHYRGTIEGGFCVRRVETFLPDSERRYFVFNSVAWSADEHIPAMVEDCARRIRSAFFSVDIAQRDDGALRIVEIGDGQVSDLVGWTPEKFAAIFHAAGRASS